MTPIEQVAEAFRAALIPTVAKKIKWSDMEPDSKSSYIEAARAALDKLNEIRGHQ